VLDTLPVCDIFLPSIDELRTLTSMNKEADLLAWCHAHGATRVVLKRGAEGVTVSEEGTITRIEPHRVQALDATGAGDCFDGSLLARLALGDSLLQAARYANAAAALATTGYGAVAPLPRPAQVQALLG
jgi:2-dehydro-3-deoxygluconokinase